MTLTQQVQQQTNKVFRQMLQQAQSRCLHNGNIYKLNMQTADNLSVSGGLTDAVFAQTNNICHVINQI